MEEIVNPVLAPAIEQNSSKKKWIIISIIIVGVLLITGSLIFYYSKAASLKKVDEKEEIIIGLELVQAKCWLECPYIDAKTSLEDGTWNIREEDAIEYGGLENMFQIEPECRNSCNKESSTARSLQIESLSTSEKKYLDEQYYDKILPIAVSWNNNCGKEVTKEGIRSCLINQIGINFPEEDISKL